MKSIETYPTQSHATEGLLGAGMFRRPGKLGLGCVDRGQSNQPWFVILANGSKNDRLTKEVSR